MPVSTSAFSASRTVYETSLQIYAGTHKTNGSGHVVVEFSEPFTRHPAITATARRKDGGFAITHIEYLSPSKAIIRAGHLSAGDDGLVRIEPLVSEDIYVIAIEKA